MPFSHAFILLLILCTFRAGLNQNGTNGCIAIHHSSWFLHSQTLNMTPARMPIHQIMIVNVRISTLLLYIASQYITHAYTHAQLSLYRSLFVSFSLPFSFFFFFLYLSFRNSRFFLCKPYTTSRMVTCVRCASNK